MTPIGFTGTQEGATEHQLDTLEFWLRYLLAKLGPLEGHHGDCFGSDATFHWACKRLGIARVIHPPDNSSKRAHCAWLDPHVTSHNPLPYLERNMVIVDSTVLMLATPLTLPETQRSGTWSTVRYAERAKRPAIVIQPQGDWVLRGSRPGWMTL